MSTAKIEVLRAGESLFTTEASSATRTAVRIALEGIGLQIGDQVVATVGGSKHMWVITLI